MEKIITNLDQKILKLARCYTGTNNNNKLAEVNTYV
jgi:hypothetical protein